MFKRTRPRSPMALDRCERVLYASMAALVGGAFWLF